MENNKKTIFVLLAVITVLVIALITISFFFGAKMADKKSISNQTIAIDESGTQSQAGSIDTNSGQTLDEETIARIALIESSEAKVAGADLITPDNKVINQEGSYVRTDVALTGAEAPKQTKALIKEDLPAEVIKINVSLGKFSPASFTVKAGEAITISLSSVDEYPHSFVFRSPLLQGVGLGVASGETRATTFNAPEQKGEYEFYCNVGGDKVGHVVRGEIGVMIVE